MPISTADIGRKAVIRVAPRASRLRVTAAKLAEEESGGHRWPPVTGLGALTCGSTVACHSPTPNCQNVLDQPLKTGRLAVWGGRQVVDTVPRPQNRTCELEVRAAIFIRSIGQGASWLRPLPSSFRRGALSMAFNSDTYHANKYRHEARDYLKEARRLKAQIAAGDCTNWLPGLMRNAVKMARTTWRLSLLYRDAAERRPRHS